MVDNNVSSVIDELIDMCKNTKDDEVACQFNVLDEMHANENSHTRILINLLSVPFVCKSFFDYMRNCKHLKLPVVSDGEKISTNCFGDYIDGRIEIGSGDNKRFVIIENKVKGAGDRERQIDRYSKIAAGQVKDSRNVYVIYLTKRSGRVPGEYSFREARKLLDYKNPIDAGRFVVMNYKDHILDWLQNGLLFSQAQIECQPLLNSGIAQYIDYIQGPELLDCRSARDVHRTLKSSLREVMRNLSGEEIVAVGTTLRYEECRFLSNAGSETVCLDDCPIEVQVIALKRKVYSAFGQAVADTEFNRQIAIYGAGKIPVAKVNVGQWASISKFQIDVFFDSDCDSKAYQVFVRKVNFKKKADCEYEWAGKTAYRYNINTVGDVVSVISALKQQDCTQCKQDVSCLTWRFGNNIAVIEECLSLQLEKCAQGNGVKKWGAVEVAGVSIGFEYSNQKRNNWYLQLIESFEQGDFNRSVELFPSRQCETIARMQECVDGVSALYPFSCEKWDGRVVYRFPVVGKEYAEELCVALLGFIDSMYDVTGRREMIDAVRNLAGKFGLLHKVRVVYVDGEKQTDIKSECERELGRPWLACGVPAAFSRSSSGGDINCFACIVEQDGYYEAGLRRPPESDCPFDGKGDCGWWLRWTKNNYMSKDFKTLDAAIAHLNALFERGIRRNEVLVLS